MTSVKEQLLLAILLSFNTRLEKQDYTPVTLNDLEEIVESIKTKKRESKPKKPKKLIIKHNSNGELPFKPKTPEPEPKKLTIKPKKLTIKPKKLTIKPKKLIIKPKKLSSKSSNEGSTSSLNKTDEDDNFPVPEDFENEYKYFIAICSLINQKVYKFETTMWDGPAIIIHLFDNFNNKIKNKFKINTVVDTLSNSKIAIYPSKNTFDETIVYEDTYMNEIETEKFEYKIRGKTIYIDVETRQTLDGLNELERCFYIEQMLKY